MAVYPDKCISWEQSRAIPNSGIKKDKATDGKVRTRRDQAGTDWDLSVVHEWLTDLEVQALEDFFDNNGLGPHTVSIRNRNYSAKFLERPTVIRYKGNMSAVESRMTGDRV